MSSEIHKTIEEALRDLADQVGNGDYGEGKNFDAAALEEYLEAIIDNAM